MARIKIRCPKCGWILGDTEHSLDCNINCPKCNSVKVKMNIVSFSDYYKQILEGEK